MYSNSGSTTVSSSRICKRGACERANQAIPWQPPVSPHYLSSASFRGCSIQFYHSRFQFRGEFQAYRNSEKVPVVSGSLVVRHITKRTMSRSQSCESTTHPSWAATPMFLHFRPKPRPEKADRTETYRIVDPLRENEREKRNKKLPHTRRVGANFIFLLPLVEARLVASPRDFTCFS